MQWAGAQAAGCCRAITTNLLSTPINFGLQGLEPEAVGTKETKAVERTARALASAAKAAETTPSEPRRWTCDAALRITRMETAFTSAYCHDIVVLGRGSARSLV
jgi:hypothetical protein